MQIRCPRPFVVVPCKSSVLAREDKFRAPTDDARIIHLEEVIEQQCGGPIQSFKMKQKHVGDKTVVM